MKVVKREYSLMLNQSIDYKLIEQGIVNGDDNWNYRDVISPFHRLYYIDKGEVFIKNKKIVYKLTEGKFYFMKSYSKLDYYAVNEFKEYYVHFQCPLLIKGDLLDSVPDFFEIPTANVDKDKYVEMFNNTSLQSYLGGWLQFQIIVNNIIEKCNVTDISYVNKNNEYHNLFNYIQIRNSIKISVEEMAKIQKQSSSHFSKQFRENFGISPKAYLHMYITEKAKIMLLQTSSSIKQVGFELGFEDSSYFSRFFKRRTGIYPLEYRSKNKMF